MLTTFNTFDWIMIIGSVIAFAAGSWLKHANKVLDQRIARMNRLRDSRR